MSDSDHPIPYVPFDPRETGPRDLLREAWDRTIADVYEREHGPYLVWGSVLVLLVAWGAFGFPTPSIPNWVLVAILVSLIGAGGLGWHLGKPLAAALHSKSDVLLSEQNGLNGDQRLIAVSPDVAKKMTVINHNGVRKDRSFLQDVMINGRKALEVDCYVDEKNIAVASWQAGVTSSEIRADRRQVKRIKTEMERQADKATEVMANNSAALRDGFQALAMRVVGVTAKVDLPDGQGVHDEISSALDEADPSDDLLGDMGLDGDEIAGYSADVDPIDDEGDDDDPDASGGAAAEIEVSSGE